MPGAAVKIMPNGSPAAQHSLLIDAEHAVAVAKFLRDDAELALDYLSNVTGVDWLDKEIAEKVKVRVRLRRRGRRGADGGGDS